MRFFHKGFAHILKLPLCFECQNQNKKIICQVQDRTIQYKSKNYKGIHFSAKIQYTAHHINTASREKVYK